ncbi:hypothetical protein OAY03_02505, partial [Candidatus Thioglobus sp.]|nr:hypothetical protein [Candidatus Thioglobus sp.]
MKNFLQISLLSIALVGCSSIDYAELSSPVSPSKTQIDRIIALNLSHTESIKEANKLMDPVLVSTVVKALEARKLKTDNAAIEAENVAIYAEMVEVSDDNLKFVGPKISEINKRNMIGNPENFDYFLLGSKDKSDGSIQHKLNFSITYTSSEKRNYSSASYCDKWDGCDSENLMDIALISSKASGCTSYECSYNEIIELN